MRIRSALVASAVAVLSILVASPAGANSLVNSSPISGSSLSSAPSAVTLTTQIALLDVGNSVTVTDPKGARVDDGALTVSGVNVIIGLKPLTVSGKYTVKYALLSNNQVPLQGAFNFTYAAPSVITLPTPSSTSTSSNAVSSSSATSLFVIGLVFAAFVVFVLLVLYTRNIFKKK
ncbi:MAG TPA: copper resistance protein CopC [Candidatus Nanopelagicaceae bacterium]